METVEKVEMRVFHCERCGWKWITRLRGKKQPKLCPKCHNPNWYKPKLAGAKPRQEKRKKGFYDHKKLIKAGKGNIANDELRK